MLAARLLSAPLRRLLPPPLRASSSLSRAFTSDTTAEAQNRSVDVSRRERDAFFPSSSFADALDPLFPTRSLSQMLNLMDSLTDFGAPRGGGWFRRKGWDAREDDDGLCLRVDMPGLDKGDVKVTVEQNTLMIRGESSGEEEGEGEERRRYSSRIELPSDLYKLDGIKGEMKNGVLKVFVPKVKAEERKEVVQVQIE